MKVPIQIPLYVTLKNVPQPSVARNEVAKAAGALGRFHKRITACSVVITAPEARHRSGGLFDVHVVLEVPGRPSIVVNRQSDDQPERQHLAASLRDAFAAVRRRLQDSVSEMRGEVKVGRARKGTQGLNSSVFTPRASRRR